ncbi:MAG: hypothetical protein ACXAC7_02985 [Candidatus Hodarchaeales archaeon]
MYRIKKSNKIRGVGISAHAEEEFELVKRMIHQEDSRIECLSFDSIIENPQYLDSINFLLTVGGDGSVAWLVGTFFKAFERVDTIKPIVPVVRPESVGYLKQLDLSPERKFRKGFRELLKGHYEIENRTILKTNIGGQSMVSVNEIFLDCTPHLGKFEVSIENGSKKETVTEHYADGVMLVTAIGSTAWALSHGGFLNVNEDALELIFIGATHHGANFILPRTSPIKIRLELKNPVVTKETVFAYNEARKKLNLPYDDNSRDTLGLVYGSRLIVDGKVVGFSQFSNPDGSTEITIDPSMSIPMVSIQKQSTLEKARKFTENIKR